MFKDRVSDKKWFTHQGLEVRESTIENSGNGIFAICDIPARTLIESSPVIIFHAQTFPILNEAMGGRHLLADYPFSWPDGNTAIALGWGSIFQHSSKPNIAWRPYDKDYNAVVFTTKRDIKAGEELFIKYLRDPAHLWFVEEDVDLGSISESSLSPVGRVLIGLNENPFKEWKQRPENVETLGSVMNSGDEKKD